MSLSFDLRITIKFYGDEALAWAVEAAVDAVLLHEDVYNEVGAFYHVADDGMLVVCAETGAGAERNAYGRIPDHRRRRATAPRTGRSYCVRPSARISVPTWRRRLSVPCRRRSPSARPAN